MKKMIKPMRKIKQFITDHDILILTLVASALSVASFLYYYHNGLITAYGDSRGHLNIARRVVDSLTPGAAQLGGYWLPLLHILMLPTIWNDFMWQSGLSGSIPNMIAFVLAVIFMYKLVFYIARDKYAALIGASVLLLNPNLLYMQATPMTEALFIYTIIAFMYFFYCWFQEKRISDLIFAGLFLILASFDRYEGWGLVIATNVLIFWYWVQTKFDKKIEGAMVVLATLSFFGIFLWLLWGAVIFHDPLEFMHNALSAGTQTKALEQNFDWMGQGNIYEAILTNAYSILDTFGTPIVILFVFGIFAYIIRNKSSIFNFKFLILFLLFVPFLFDVLTVYTGKVPIEVPNISRVPVPWNYFNIRYALYSLPASALFIGLISKKRIFQVVFFVCILISYWFIAFDYKFSMITIKDIGAQKDSEEINQSIGWFKDNYNGGLILASTGGQDKYMFRMGIDQKNFITEGAYHFYDESLANPAKYASWVIISNNNLRDSLYKSVNKDVLFKEFSVVSTNNTFIILKKIKDD
jgi:hypothetical protein